MIVSNTTLDIALNEIKKATKVSFDSETTGLNPYLGAKIFSFIISTKEKDYYFNINNKPDHLGVLPPHEYILPEKVLNQAADILNKMDRIYIHNAKFDLRFLLCYGLNITAEVFCTYAMSRLVNNQLPSYSLSNLGKLIGHEKDDRVEKYITKNKLYTLVEIGKKTPKKDKHYDLVPFEIISKYGLQDGRVCFELGEYLEKRLSEINNKNISLGLPSIITLISNELRLTKVLLKMEHKGILIDKDYTKKAYEYYIDKCNELEAKFSSLVGIDYEDSPKVFKEAFKIMGLEHGYTEKGNASFSEENLPNNTLGDLIKEHRHAYKLSGTYYRNFLDLSDKEGAVHTNFKQAGTSTGRLSCSEPNLQNVPKRGEDKNPFPVRKCFIPREGYFFSMIDFDQMEYRLLLDLAGEKNIIYKIISEGLDVHTATAKNMGVDRTHAKTLNFMLLYGGGAAKLASTLQVTLQKAKSLKSKYFSVLRKVSRRVKALINTVEKRGFITNIYGRNLLKPIQGSYAIPNHYIQGSCGDIVKEVMINLDDYLSDKKSYMLLQIHDEIVFEIHESEKYILADLTKIMTSTYKPRALTLTAGCDYSKSNWYDKKPYKGEI